MKFQKFWQKERDSIIRLLNDPIWHLELILVNFQSTPSLKNSTCTKIFRQEDNNSNRRENIRAYAMNSFLKITHTLIAMERANRSLKPSNSRSRESVGLANNNAETNVICLFQVQQRYDTRPPVLFHADWRVKGGSSRQFYCLEMNGYTMVSRG